MPQNFAGGLDRDTRTKMIDLLNARLADMTALQLATKQTHWNIKGSGFIGVHELLDTVYEQIGGHLDLIAERCVLMGGIAEGTVEAAAKGAEMKAFPLDLTDLEAALQEYTQRVVEVGRRIREAIETASDAGDEDTSDLFTEISRSLDRAGWLVGSNLPEAKLKLVENAPKQKKAS